MEPYRFRTKDLWVVSEESECWEWIGSNGTYGRFWNGSKQVYAHRHMYQIVNGKIPDGDIIMHRCDNPPCVNPSHLKSGSMRENSLDMVSKGRNYVPVSRGESSPVSKLSEDEVKRIRDLSDSGMRQVDIASSFNISQSNVSDIVRRNIWTHV